MRQEILISLEMVDNVQNAKIQKGIQDYLDSCPAEWGIQNSYVSEVKFDLAASLLKEGFDASDKIWLSALEKLLNHHTICSIIVKRFDDQTASFEVDFSHDFDENKYISFDLNVNESTLEGMYFHPGYDGEGYIQISLENLEELESVFAIFTGGVK